MPNIGIAVAVMMAFLFVLTFVRIGKQQGLKHTLFLGAVLLLPTVEVACNLSYVVSTQFPLQVVGVAVLVSLLPAGHFAYTLYLEEASPRFSFRYDFGWPWLDSALGTDRWDNLPKFVMMLLYLALQSLVVVMVNLPIFGVGAWLHVTKLMCIPAVRDVWYSAWTGGASRRAEASAGTHEHGNTMNDVVTDGEGGVELEDGVGENASLVADEPCCHIVNVRELNRLPQVNIWLVTVPNLILQLSVAYATDRFTRIFVVSAAVSAYTLAVDAFDLVYFRVYKALFPPLRLLFWKLGRAALSCDNCVPNAVADTDGTFSGSARPSQHLQAVPVESEPANPLAVVAVCVNNLNWFVKHHKKDIAPLVCLLLPPTAEYVCYLAYLLSTNFPTKGFLPAYALVSALPAGHFAYTLYLEEASPRFSFRYDFGWPWLDSALETDRWDNLPKFVMMLLYLPLRTSVVVMVNLPLFGVGAWLHVTKLMCIPAVRDVWYSAWTGGNDRNVAARGDVTIVPEEVEGHRRGSGSLGEYGAGRDGGDDGEIASEAAERVGDAYVVLSPPMIMPSNGTNGTCRHFVDFKAYKRLQHVGVWLLTVPSLTIQVIMAIQRRHISLIFLVSATFSGLIIANYFFNMYYFAVHHGVPLDAVPLNVLGWNVNEAGLYEYVCSSEGSDQPDEDAAVVTVPTGGSDADTAAEDIELAPRVNSPGVSRDAAVLAPPPPVAN